MTVVTAIDFYGTSGYIGDDFLTDFIKDSRPKNKIEEREYPIDVWVYEKLRWSHDNDNWGKFGCLKARVFQFDRDEGGRRTFLRFVYEKLIDGTDTKQEEFHRAEYVGGIVSTLLSHYRSRISKVVVHDVEDEADEDAEKE